MSSVHEYDHVVVGGGIVGSWTAMHLAKAGKEVALLEKFEGVHTRGSSHGHSRLIRSCYPERHFSEMMPHAIRIWGEAEQESGKQLLERCGVYCMASDPAVRPQLEEGRRSMEEFTPGGIEMDPDMSSLPLKYDADLKVMKDKTGGGIYAQRSLQTVRMLFLKHGGHLHENCTVLKIDELKNCDKTAPADKSGKQCVCTSESKFVANSVVVCAGAWTRDLLVPHLVPSLPLQPAAVKIYYWKVKSQHPEADAKKFPAMIDLIHPEIYSIPSLEYPGLVKVCVHGGTPCTADTRDRVAHNPKLEEALFNYVRKHMPTLEKDPAITETCMYTLTPDECFVIDYAPGNKNIVFGTGFSGTGFKTSPAVGKLLSEMAQGEKPFLDISPYSFTRFDHI